jgi:hypothetical protein
MLDHVAFHYCKIANLADIFRDGVLLPAPPLATYGLERAAVEAEPGRYGFGVRRKQGRRYFWNESVAHRNVPGLLSLVCWYEEEQFVVSFSRADWCHSALGYLPPGKAEAGWAFRLEVNLEGLDVFGWSEFQSRTNVPGPYRRWLGERSRARGDDPDDWLFVAGPVPLDERWLNFEQYYRGRWTGLDEVTQRLPLEEMYALRPNGTAMRPRFRSHYIRAVRGRVPASLFGIVWGEDGRWLADHLWVRQTWSHLQPGDAVEFFASVTPYRRQDGTESFTLSEINGLIRLGLDSAREEN